MSAGLTPRLRVGRDPASGDWAIWVHHDRPRYAGAAPGPNGERVGDVVGMDVYLLELDPEPHWSGPQPEGSIWPNPTAILPYGQAEWFAQEFARAFGGESDA